MYQADKTTYKRDSATTQFFRSGFGKFCIVLIIVAAGLFLSALTVPSNATMEEETLDAVRQCIESANEHRTDRVDEIVNNVAAVFTTADTTKTEEAMQDFHRYNRLEIYPHKFYSTARIHNNFAPNGNRVAFGILGIVIPTVSVSDMILRSGPVRKEYNQKIIKEVIGDDEEYYGDNPDLKHRYGPYKKFDNYN